MKRERVMRLRTHEGNEIELHPSAFVVSTPDSPQTNPDRCACTHSLLVEHNEAGCLKGCSPATCAQTDTETRA